jgi:glycosyltransferase involved in cell wall biosynthesis
MMIKATTELEGSQSGVQTRRPTVTVLVPARNQEKNLPHVLPRIPYSVDQLLLVDGLSTDRTNELAKELRPDITIVKQDGKGKGNAIKCGIEAATGDIIVMLDADGSMNPEEISSFIQPLLDGYDFVKGSRFIRGGGTDDMERVRKLGNRVFVTLLNLLFGGRSTDLCYGYLAFKREAINRFKVESDGFEIETELNVKALKAGLKVTEVPSFEEKRMTGTSNLKAFRDGKRIIRTLFRLRFSRNLN